MIPRLRTPRLGEQVVDPPNAQIVHDPVAAAPEPEPEPEQVGSKVEPEPEAPWSPDVLEILDE